MSWALNAYLKSINWSGAQNTVHELYLNYDIWLHKLLAFTWSCTDFWVLLHIWQWSVLHLRGCHVENPIFDWRFKICDKENLICPSSKISLKAKKLWVWDICMEWIDLQYIWRPIIRRVLFQWCPSRIWAKLVKIQVFPSPTSYMLISFGFTSLIDGISFRFF